MKIKCQNFHKQIRKRQIQDIFQRKRQQFMNMQKQNQEIYMMNKHEANYQNSHELIQLLEQNSTRIKQYLTVGNYSQIKETAKDLYYKISQFCKKPISYQRKNRIIQIIISYNYPQLLSMSVVQTFSQSPSHSSVIRQLCKYTTLTFYIIFKYFTTEQITINNPSFSFCLFICLNQLHSEDKMIKKIFMILFNAVCCLDGFKEQFYIKNKYQERKININHVFTMMDMKKQYAKCEEFHQINMYFIALYRNYIYQVNNIKTYSQNKQNFRSNHQHFQKNNKLQEILHLLQYPNSTTIQKKLIPKQYKLLAQQIINIAKQYLLQNWTDDNDKQADLMDCVLTLKTVYEFFQQFDLQVVIKQAAQFLNLIPIKYAKDHLKNQIIQYLDKVIFLDKKDQITKSLLKHQNLIPILLSYNIAQSSSIRLNIFSNLLTFSYGITSIKKNLNHIIIFLSSNHNIQPISILTFIKNYFISNDYQYECKQSYDKFVINLLYQIDRDNYSQRQLILETEIFINLYQNGFDQRLPQKYYQWYQMSKFSYIIDHVVEKVNYLIQMSSMEEE